jgi:hypothetical protein
MLLKLHCAGPRLGEHEVLGVGGASPLSAKKAFGKLPLPVTFKESAAGKISKPFSFVSPTAFSWIQTVVFFRQQLRLVLPSWLLERLGFSS